MRKFRVLQNRNYEWPVTHMWYTKKKGQTIEEIIDTDPEFFIWMVETFQNVTPKQASRFRQRTGIIVPGIFIQDVEPYDHIPADPDKLYMELCDTQDLSGTLKKYRGIQLNLF